MFVIDYILDHPHFHLPLYLLFTAVVTALMKQRTPAQEAEFARKNPKIAGLVRILKGWSVDSPKIIGGVTLLIKGYQASRHTTPSMVDPLEANGHLALYPVELPHLGDAPGVTSTPHEIPGPPRLP